MVILAPRVGEPETTAPHYSELQAAELRHVGPLAGHELRVDRALFRFERGELYLLDPVADLGTGAVFIGKGRFELVPPDRVERQQVDKYFDQETVDTEFKELTLRFTDDTAERLRALAGTGGRADVRKARKIWRDRHKAVLNDRLVDLDARVAMDLAEIRAGTARPDSPFFFAEIEAKGGLTLEIDSFNTEEIRLYKSHGADRAWDNWTSFHRERDYAPLAPGDETLARLPVREQWQPAAEVPEIAIDMALDARQIDATAELWVRANRPIATLRLSISPILTVREVRWRPGAPPDPWPDQAWMDAGDARAPHDPDGASLPFLQTRIGRGLDEDRTEPRVTVFLPQPLQAGEEILLQVRYDGKLFDELATRDYFNRDTTGWFPRHVHARRSRFHTLFRMPTNRRVATAGTLQREIERDGRRIELRSVGRAEANLSFHYGDLKVQEYTPEGHAPVTIYSSPNMIGLSAGKRDEVLDDLTSATRLYSEYFGPPPFDRLVITETPARGGQSFAGFLMLSFNAFGSMHSGEADLFRTHELAHQWWGNAVRWSSYRDQWLSEGFAQYTAALHTLLALEDADQFDDMMKAWGKDALAKMDVGQRFGMRHFGFTPAALRDSDGAETGPIWVGYRLSSDKTPLDYRLQVYEKGAYVVHMLRMMLIDWDSGDDSRFRELMRGFYHDHRDTHASTEDFLAAVSEAFDEPMDWFFDQWVYGIGIPKYDADLEPHRVGGSWRLQGRIRQRDVPAGFRMPVPIRVTYRDESSEVFRVQVDASQVDVDLPLAGRPDEVELNPMWSVLARR